MNHSDPEAQCVVCLRHGGHDVACPEAPVHPTLAELLARLADVLADLTEAVRQLTERRS
ncbi:hypothetical protein HOT45_gp60 [Gordonia phage Trine]|uniref:Uncharacterized protein n=1 Tax=Gordonia phage Trine TaxID=2201431 RepID=A0A2Z4Q933_9CAUD|nr:hypothetical protein HOT45_gp60 [Gordonia phage Trine]AWY06561.1 hypothetical protein PBI_TRINE_60 [Gordonia phage Trine]